MTSSQYLTIPGHAPENMCEVRRVVTPLTFLGDQWVHYMQPVWHKICPMDYFELNEPVSLGDQMAEREVPNVFPILIIKLGHIFQPFLMQFAEVGEGDQQKMVV